VAEKQQASPLITLAVYGTVKFFSEDTTHSPASYAHTTHTGLEMMPSDAVSLGKFPCFIIYCLTSKWYSTERFLSLLASAHFLHCHTFPFTMRKFLSALKLFVFSV
jgi:hypothetical protein